jgi:hypothetical protein
MKNTIYLAFLTLICLNSCSTKIESTEPWKDITILYGMLNHQDTAHYVVVQKAYLDPSRGAYEIAQINDSLYYPENSISVQLRDSVNNQLIGTFTRVDVALEGFTVENSIFNTQPKYAYKYKGNLNRTKAYRVVVTKPNGTITSAAAQLVDTFRLNPYLGALNLTSQPEATLTMGSLDRVATVYEHYLVIKFSENGVTKQVKWKFKEESPIYAPGSHTVKFSTSGFYQFLKNSLSPMTAGSRQLCRISWEVWAAGPDYYKYVSSANIDLGVTGAFSIANIISNVKNGYGVVSTRYFNALNNPLILEVYSMDSLSMGRFTRNLGFLRSAGNCL